MKKLIALSVALLSVLFIFPSCGEIGSQKNMLGVWWWDSRSDAEPYLSFAAENGVTEIYYCDSRLNENTADFIRRCNENRIKVYLLAGEYQWLRNPQPLYDLIDRYVDFCDANPDARFEGVHLDIEPHQDSAFSDERAALLESLISLSYNLSVDYADIKFDYDIPFWIDDEIEFNGETLPAYSHIIRNANRTFIMSYRDTAEAIYKTAKDEIEFAKLIGKTLVLGVETYSEEGDNVSFLEEGKLYMSGELEKLRKMIPENFGISVHQIKTWYNLKD